MGRRVVDGGGQGRGDRGRMAEIGLVSQKGRLGSGEDLRARLNAGVLRGRLDGDRIGILDVFATVRDTAA